MEPLILVEAYNDAAKRNIIARNYRIIRSTFNPRRAELSFYAPLVVLCEM